MKKIILTPILIVSLVCVCFFCLAGCCKKKFNFSNELEGTLTIVGSSSSQEVCDALAKKFSQKHKKVKVNKSSAGSAQAAISVADKTAQIGDLSRELNLDEKPNLFDAKTIAIDGIAVCTNLENKINNLSSKQLNEIFTGKIKNWSELKGPNAPIVVLGRDEASGTKTCFERLINAKNSCAYSIMLDSNGKIKEKIKNDRDAIGYISLSNVDNSVKPVAIDQVFPSKATILNSSYKLFHPFIQITLKNQHDELTSAWFDFLKTDGRQTIEQSRLIPVL